jgi:cytosine permease
MNVNPDLNNQIKMASSSSSTTEYARTPVPASARVSGWRVALIKLGIVIALPGFVMGAQIGAALGLKLGSISILIGGMMLMVMAGLTGTVAARSGLSTSMITQFAFGRLGGRFVNAILAATLLGWFGVTAQIFGESLQGVMASLDLAVWPAQIYVVLGGALMVATTIFGFSALQRLSDFAIPLLLVVLLIATYRSLQLRPLAGLLATNGPQTGLGIGISAVVGGLATSICIFPDLCRFARTPGGARLAAGLTFGLGMPFILILAAITSIVAGQHDIILILTTLGLGLPALLLLVFKAWATNSGNLYSASLGMATIFSRFSQSRIVIGGGIVGVVLAALGITTHLIPFFLILSITIPSIAGIYVADFFLLRGQRYDLEQLATEPLISWLAFAAWGTGIAVAAMTTHKIMTLTGMPAADSILTSFGLYLFFKKLFGRRMMPTSALV